MRLLYQSYLPLSTPAANILYDHCRFSYSRIPVCRLCIETTRCLRLLLFLRRALTARFSAATMVSMHRDTDPSSDPSSPTKVVANAEPALRVRSDVPFYLILVVIGGTYVVLLLALLLADIAYMMGGEAKAADPAWSAQHPVAARVVDHPMVQALADPNIRSSIKLSLISCTITAILSLWVAVPVGYLLSRQQFFGKNLLDALLDIPIVLPPLVVGLSLLILFQYMPNSVRDAVVYQVPAVILAQFVVSCAFAVRTMRATFDQMDRRREQVALTLGCNRQQAFWWVVLPEAGPGMITAGTLAWARALGEFGPLLIFAGTTRGKTEVLSTTVFLELSIGNLQAAVAVSLLMITIAVTLLLITRIWASQGYKL